MRTTMAIAMMVTCLAGCGGNSLATVRAEHAQGGGTSRLYAASAADAYAASVRVLHAESVDPLEEHQAEGYAVGHKTPSVVPYRQGAYVGVWVEASGADHAKVTVVTEREAQGNFATGLTEGAFHEELAAELAKKSP